MLDRLTEIFLAIHREMPRWLQVAVYVILSIGILYSSLYQYTKDIYLSGLIQEYRAGDEQQPAPMPIASPNHYIRYDTSTSTLTNRQGLFTIPVGAGYLWPFQTITLHMGVADNATQSVPVSAWSVWNPLTPPKELNLFYVARTKTTNRYFRSLNDAIAAYQSSDSVSAAKTVSSRAAPIANPLALVLHAQEDNSQNDLAFTRSVRLHSLHFPAPDSDLTLDARVAVDGISVDAQSLQNPVIVHADADKFFFDNQPIPVPREGGLRITLTRPRFLLPAIEVARCDIELSGQRLGKIILVPCDVLGPEMPQFAISFEVFPHLSVSFMSREVRDAYVVRIWLDVEREALQAVASVTYELPELFRNRLVTEPRLKAADFYIYGVSTYTPDFPVSATVTLSSGSVWQGTARIVSVDQEPTTAAGSFAKATLFYPTIGGDADLENALSLAEAAIAMDPAFARAVELRARIEFGAQRRDDGLRYFRQAMGLDPEDPLILNDYAWNLIQTDPIAGDDLALAKTLAQQSVDLDRQVAYLDTLAWIHYLSQEYEEAASLLREAVAMDDRRTAWQAAQYHLGRVCEEQNDRECAAKAYKEVVEYADRWPLASDRTLAEAAKMHLESI